jgi:hypothetical protein
MFEVITLSCCQRSIQSARHAHAPKDVNILKIELGPEHVAITA